MLRKTKMIPEYREVSICCAGYIEIATHNCIKGGI